VSASVFRMPLYASTGDGFRSLLCGSYEACLDHAVVNQWPGFTCASCALAVDLYELDGVPFDEMVVS